MTCNAEYCNSLLFLSNGLKEKYSSSFSFENVVMAASYTQKGSRIWHHLPDNAADKLAICDISVLPGNMTKWRIMIKKLYILPEIVHLSRHETYSKWKDQTQSN